ncbi:excinuclease ABC subunit UvrC [Williamwhitmania taraxaci]|uniref:UvrABC system protein C n=1 Tax=Williamwhitmania taraxaci TaxID=1640674 RepID=A0A1G6GXT8_9BACT|nr:excinuclease ABC subunit UvrC [Williamwhitmania taraxaci]SDB86837.1 Excinuclease ABC subunit C [Williamwhitmania taraxaci]
MDTSFDYKVALESLPSLPGVYQFFDRTGKIIYVGKAKNLRKRVSSYFNKTHQSGKVTVLVRKIVEIRHIIVNTESDALLLENTLIKQFQPRYNILLKDDKTYPWVVITTEDFPRVFVTRRTGIDGWRYYGPYTSGISVRGLMELFRNIYKVRSCKLPLTTSSIRAGKFKVCLEYHIGNCPAPCEGLQSEESYHDNIRSITSILRGNTTDVIKEMKVSMALLSAELKFEKAQLFKDRIDLLLNWQIKSTVVNSSITNVDVVYLYLESSFGVASFFRVVHGSVVQSITFEVKANLDESKEEILTVVLNELKLRFGFLCREVLVPFLPEIENFVGINLIIPQRGDKKILLDLAEKNCKEHLASKMKILEKVDPGRRAELLLLRMQKELHIVRPPKRIECFDNSNLQGTNPVAACVVFIDGKPAKSEYRHFNIKTVVGPDDFASMEEVVFRRYERRLLEGAELPDLIVVDGGKGQLSATYNTLEKLNLHDKIPLIGLAKRLEEIFSPFDSTPLYLDKNSDTLRVLMYIRDEAHRFGITFHRNKRSKFFLESELDHIPGVGQKSKEALLRKFGNLDAIKVATIVQLQEVVKLKIAGSVFGYFNN